MISSMYARVILVLGALVRVAILFEMIGVPTIASGAVLAGLLF